MFIMKFRTAQNYMSQISFQFCSHTSDSLNVIVFYAEVILNSSHNGMRIFDCVYLNQIKDKIVFSYFGSLYESWTTSCYCQRYITEEHSRSAIKLF
jgi:hypothetical protein